MLGAVNHQGSHRVPKSQLSSKCRLFRTGWQNPEINNKASQVKQSLGAAAMEKPHFQDINSLQNWQPGCLGMQVPQQSVLKESLTLVLPFSHSLILLTESNFGEWLILVVTSLDRAAQGTSSCPSMGKAVHTASHLFRGSPALLNSWIYGTLEDGCGTLLGQQCHCPWENGSCTTGLWVLPTAFRCPNTTSAPLLHAEVGNWKKQRWGEMKRRKIK